MIIVSSDLYLKAVTYEDQGVLINLMCQIYPPEYKHLWVNEDCDWYLERCFSQENLVKELEEKNAAYYFVFYNSDRVGILRFVYHTGISKTDKKNATFIHRIYLRRDMQGKGIGKQLFNWMAGQARVNQNEALWLKAMDTQTQALKFYEKEGYQLVDRIRLDFELIHPELRGMLILKKII